MPLIRYERIKLRDKSLALIESANVIINEYAAQGYNLTLRQLYYQFVSRDLLGNTQKNYKMLGDVVSNGRRAGLIDWNAIVDRTRYVRTHSSWDGPESIVETCASQFTVDFWANQRHRPEVWVEKDALVGVMQVACDPWQVPYFSCRGYTSDSEIWAAARRLRQHALDGFTPIIYHLGDHDPSGIDMSRDIEDRLRLFGQEALSAVLQVKRIALNMDQVEQYEPPPNPAKETDSRFAQYQREHGDESWELDALDPTTLSALIADEMKAIIDKKVWKASEADRDVGRRELAAISGHWDSVSQFLVKKKFLEPGDE